VSGSSGVMSVMLLETAAGGALVLWASGVWGKVRRGFFLLIGISLTLCALGAWGLVAGQVDRVDPSLASAAGAAATGLAVFTGLLALWQVLLVAAPPGVARVAGLVAAVAGLVALVLVGLVRPSGTVAAIAGLLLGSVFLGSTLFGLLLGHWYLVERRLSNVYMVRSAWWYAGGVVAAIAALALSTTQPGELPALELNPLLAIPGFSALLAGGLVFICALIAAFVWKLAHEGGRSIQAATGYYYLAVIMAFPAELATKLRFF
jgi:hypothetical protein